MQSAVIHPIISAILITLLSLSASASKTLTDQQIVFLSDRVDGSEIYIMDSDGSDVRRITSVAFNLGDVIDASVSPDGVAIAFVTGWNPGILLVSSDGACVRDLIHELAFFGAPSWFPNGRKIVFSSMRDGNHEIYAMDADGSNPFRLTNNTAADLTPTWSPDGRQIAFESERDGLPSIFVMNADGTNPIRLTPTTAYSGQPAWSPDGDKIAFVSDRDGAWAIYMMNTDGSHVTRLTDAVTGNWRPRWSPDGSRIAFSSHRDGNTEIYVMNADGSNQIRLTNNPAVDLMADWPRTKEPTIHADAVSEMSCVYDFKAPLDGDE